MYNQFPQIQFHSYFYYFMPLQLPPMYFHQMESLDTVFYLIKTSNNGFSQASSNINNQQQSKPQKLKLPAVDNSVLQLKSNKIKYQSQSIFKLQDDSESQRQIKKSKQPSNDNRNVKSNILRIFFKRIKHSAWYGPLIQKIIGSLRLTITKQNFIKWAKNNLNVKTSNYVSLSKAKRLFKTADPTEHTLILRLIFKHYQQNELVVQSLTSRKIKDKSIKNHLLGIRYIKKQLFSHTK